MLSRLRLLRQWLSSKCAKFKVVPMRFFPYTLCYIHMYLYVHMHVYAMPEYVYASYLLYYIHVWERICDLLLNFVVVLYFHPLKFIQLIGAFCGTSGCSSYYICIWGLFRLVFSTSSCRHSNGSYFRNLDPDISKYRNCREVQEDIESSNWSSYRL